MNVGTRYREGRIGRPREIGGWHVREEKEGGREGGVEGLRQAHEARAGLGAEDAGARGIVQANREGAGQVALDGELRGGVAQVRDGAEGLARRARGRLRRRARRGGQAGGDKGLPAPGGCRPSRRRRATAARWTCRRRPSTAGSRRATTA